MEKYKALFNPSFLSKNNGSIPSPLPADATVTMAYIPFQQAPVIYDDDKEALCNGTLFPELDKPFEGKGVNS